MQFLPLLASAFPVNNDSRHHKNNKVEKTAGKFSTFLPRLDGQMRKRYKFCLCDRGRSATTFLKCMAILLVILKTKAPKTIKINEALVRVLPDEKD